MTSGSFVIGHLLDGIVHFLHREGFIKRTKVALVEVKLIPIEVLFPSITLSNDVGEVVKNDFLLSLMLCDPTIIVLQSVNIIFSPPSVYVPMEVFGIGIALPQIGNAGTLFLP